DLVGLAAEQIAELRATRHAAEMMVAQMATITRGSGAEPSDALLLRALGASFGDRPFTAAAAMERARSGLVSTQALSHAIEALGIDASADGAARSMGKHLRRIEQAPPAGRLCVRRSIGVRGARDAARWRIERVSGCGGSETRAVKSGVWFPR
ncbi:MAG: hypothetical protein RR101_14680, partial [Burkholderiaceae bacterium]